MKNIPIRSGSASLPYGVTDITTGTRPSPGGRYALTASSTPSRIATRMSRSMRKPGCAEGIFLTVVPCEDRSPMNEFPSDSDENRIADLIEGNHILANEG